MSVYIKPEVTGDSRAVRFKIALTDEPDGKGKPLDGDVEICMMPDNADRNDPNSIVSIVMSQSEPKFVAHVQGGVWESGPHDFSAFAQQNLRTFLFIHDEAFAEFVVPDKPKPVSPGTPGQRQDSRQQALTLELSNFDVVKGDKTCEVVVRGILIRGNVVVVGQRMDFFREGKIETFCQTDPGVVTDENSRFEYTYKNQPLVGKRVRYEVQVRGGLRRHLDIDIPSAKKEDETKLPKEKQLKVNDGIDMVHAKKFTAVIPVETLLPTGKPVSREVVAILTSGKAVKFSLGDGTVLGEKSHRVSFSAGSDGKATLVVYFPGQFEVGLKIVDPTINEFFLLNLRYDQ